MLAAAMLLSSVMWACEDASSSSDTSGWTSVTLDPSIAYVVHHKVVGDTLHLRLRATTSGWLGFGFAETTSGHMKGADMVTAYVADSSVFAQDRHALFAPTLDVGNTYDGLTAALDDHNDWSIVSGMDHNGITEVYLTRALRTGDTQDRDVIRGPQRIVWSWGTSDTVGYHGSRRGAGLITFLSSSTGSAAARPFPAYDGVLVQRFRPYEIPARDTTYACQSMSFDVTGLSASTNASAGQGLNQTDRHVVAIRPLDEKKYHHHAILHVCTNNSYWQQHLTPQPCASDVDQGAGGRGNSPLGALNSGCSSLMWSWAVGGGAFVLPESAGFRIGTGPDAISHAILEVHYDNPGLEAGVIDEFGFEMFYVDTFRAHDAGGLTLGDPTLRMAIQNSNLPSWLPGALRWPYDSGQLKAGKETPIHRQATCPGSCTSSALDEPIQVFASNLHMHYAGQKMYSEHFAANGTSLGVRAPLRVDYFDNGFQQMTELEDGDFVIHPGDSIQTHCWYNTKARTKDVSFGFATKDEMCMHFLFYYPAQYRGTDREGKPLRFATCGMFALTTALPPLTLCGGLSQTGLPDQLPIGQLPVDPNSLPDFMMAGGQKSTGADLFADPLAFGVANLPSGGTPGEADRCWPSGAPPPPLPPSAPRAPHPSEARIRLHAFALGAIGLMINVASFALIGRQFVWGPRSGGSSCVRIMPDSRSPQLADLRGKGEPTSVPPTPSQTSSIDTTRTRDAADTAHFHVLGRRGGCWPRVV